MPLKQNIPASIKRLSNFYNTGKTKSLAYRMQQLQGIARFLKERETDIEQALYQDLRKPQIESFTAEIALIRTELKYTQKHLASWMKPRKVSTILPLLPAKSRIYPEPLGLVLIIAPWNYPIQLTLVPLIGALAAGNCAVIKPSELAPACSQLLASALANYIDPDCIELLEGGVPETNALLAEHFDHLFFTGSPAIGKIVMKAAAEHLTPITLELGGKCPCMVDKDTDLEVAARRIVWAKFSNAGQSCVAPDYLLVEKSIAQSLLKKMKRAIQQFYGEDPQKSPDYGRIINQKHYQRLSKLLSNKNDIFVGGKQDENDNYISPTILYPVTESAAIMEEEIFGPILPVISIDSIQDAIRFVNSRPKPLAIYLFTQNKCLINDIIQETSSGGICINHAMLQTAVPSLPFGGVGKSGMGAYHGKATFDTFSHDKAVLTKPTWLDPAFFYPPYKKNIKKLLRLFI